MKRLRHRQLFFAGWMLALAGFAVAEQVDPRFPSERVEPPAEEWTRWPRARIRQLEAERDQLLKKISVLPAPWVRSIFRLLQPRKETLGT